MKRIANLIRQGRPFSFDGRRVVQNSQRYRSYSGYRRGMFASGNSIDNVLNEYRDAKRNLGEQKRNVNMLLDIIRDGENKINDVIRSITDINLTVTNFFKSMGMDISTDFVNDSVIVTVNSGYVDEGDERFFGSNHLTYENVVNELSYKLGDAITTISYDNEWAGPNKTWFEFNIGLGDIGFILSPVKKAFNELQNW